MGDIGGKREQAETRLKRILELMGFAATVTSSESNGHIGLTVAGEDVGRLIGKHGQTLDALQFLLNRMSGAPPGQEAGQPGQDGAPESLPIRVDTSDGYRDRREEQLVDLARRLAEKARRTGEPVAMSPMSAVDRKVVHTALGELGDVTTRSEGDGAHRYVVILPVGSPIGGDDQSGPDAG